MSLADLKFSLRQYPYGPGTILHRYLGVLGFRPYRDCKCYFIVLIMNQEGKRWCRQHVGLIIKWMERSANRRLYFWEKWFLKAILHLAIWRAHD